MKRVFPDNVIDFTGPKMASLAKQHEMWGDILVANSIWDMHHLYLEGYLNIAWEEGMPIPTLEQENETQDDNARSTKGISS